LVETVQIGRAAIDMNVGIDHREAGRMMGKHLIARGFESIWMLGARESSDSRVVERFEGCAEVLERAGLRSDLARRQPVEDSLSFGYRTLSVVAEAGHEKPAIFFGNDLMAIGALQAAKELGLSVPRDIGIAGFNGIDLASYVDPKLTTIRVPYVEMGRLAAELLLDEIEGLPATRRRVELTPVLVEGAST
jgi:LacI family gluconate utilization system Gnt-I transcriptional repressor